MLSERRNHKFLSDYFRMRLAFRELAEAAGARLESLPLDAGGPNGERLAIDIALLGARTPRQVVLHFSGLHGVEGFAGSAIQIQTLREPPILGDSCALVLVHVLNPFGMSWLRRTNENNVDLNRNAPGDGKYAGASKEYSQLNPFLNPSSAPSRDFFALKAGLLVLRHGMAALRQAVAGGQYEYPKGLFFGGKELQQGLKAYEGFIAEYLGSAGQVIAVDVHTGLGKYGKDTLLADPSDLGKLRRIFGPQVTSSEPMAGPAYRIRGGLDSLISRALPNASVLFVTQEFGTYGPVKNLHALREENRWHHFGGGSLDHPTKRSLKLSFNPEDESWRQSVLDRGVETLKLAVKALG